ALSRRHAKSGGVILQVPRGAVQHLPYAVQIGFTVGAPWNIGRVRLSLSNRRNRGAQKQQENSAQSQSACWTHSALMTAYSFLAEGSKYKRHIRQVQG